MGNGVSLFNRGSSMITVCTPTRMASCIVRSLASAHCTHAIWLRDPSIRLSAFIHAGPILSKPFTTSSLDSNIPRP